MRDDDGIRRLVRARVRFYRAYAAARSIVRSIIKFTRYVPTEDQDQREELDATTGTLFHVLLTAPPTRAAAAAVATGHPTSAQVLYS